MTGNRKLGSVFSRIVTEMSDPRRVLDAVDSRKRRPAPSIETQYVAPRTVVEELLAGIWSDSLGLERVGINDSFFELGGHSLLGTQVVSRIREAFQVEIPLTALFKSPTVAGLAKEVGSERKAGERPVAPPVTRVSRDRDLPLSFAQQRLWFIHQLEPRSAAYNIAFPIRIRGALDNFALNQSLREIARRHDVLRTRIRTCEGRPAQVVDGGNDVELPILDLSVSASEREGWVREVAGLDAHQPFDFERGPLWRVGLVRMAGDDHVLLLCIHHVISDGWSTAVMVNEFTTLYEAFRSGRPSPLSELAVQYGRSAVAGASDRPAKADDWCQPG
jgi:acyl carrier protein